MSDYTHILVAVDFSDSATQVLVKARAIAQRYHAQLSFLHVVEYLPPIDVAYEPVLVNNWVVDENEMMEQAKKTLQKISETHGFENVELAVKVGTPKHEISQFVKDHKCDLVVMGAHGRHGLSLLLGSTANAVLHEMPCDILTVKIDD